MFLRGRLPPVDAPTSAADAVTIAADAQTIAAYKAQLEQAYNDLNDAYAQIQTLQAAQAQPSARSFFGESEHETLKSSFSAAA